MKLPAVAIAAAFCCGIAFGLWTPVAKFGTTSSALTYGFILALSLIVCGIVATGAQRLAAGAISSMLCCVARLTVVPPIDTGCSQATGVSFPVRPTCTLMSSIFVIPARAAYL